MEIGQLDRRIILQQATTTQDIYGQLNRTWTAVATVWANVNWKGGAEGFEAEELTASTTVIFTIRYYSGLVAKDRILMGSTYYDILDVAILGNRNEWMQLTTETKDRILTT